MTAGSAAYGRVCPTASELNSDRNSYTTLGDVSGVRHDFQTTASCMMASRSGIREDVLGVVQTSFQCVIWNPDQLSAAFLNRDRKDEADWPACRLR